MKKFKKIFLAILAIVLIMGTIVFISSSATHKTISLNQNNVNTQYSNIKLSLIRKLKLVSELVYETNEKLEKDSLEYKEVMDYQSDLLAYVDMTNEGKMNLKRELKEEQLVELYKVITSFDLNDYPKLKDNLTNEFVSDFAKANDRIKQAFIDYNSLIEKYDEENKTFLGNIISDFIEAEEFEKIDLEK